MSNYFDRLHCVLWSQAHDIVTKDGRQRAERWLMDLLAELGVYDPEEESEGLGVYDPEEESEGFCSKHRAALPCMICTGLAYVDA